MSLTTEYLNDLPGLPPARSLVRQVIWGNGGGLVGCRFFKDWVEESCPVSLK